MIPTDVSGSRLPVGSSQIRSGGWLTNARAIETRCCSPPESSSGSEFILCERPTSESTSGTFAPDRVAALALHLERVGDVLGRRAVRQQLEVLEDAADVAAQHAAPSSACRRPRSRPPTMMRPAVGSSSLSSRRMIVDLPEPDGADDEDELALVDHERDVAERDDVRARRPSSPHSKTIIAAGAGAPARSGARAARLRQSAVVGRGRSRFLHGVIGASAAGTGAAAGRGARPV